MKFIFITLGTFLLFMFFINLKDYLKSPRYNRWINGKIDNIDVIDEYEVWMINWIAPSSLREKNPEGEQFYSFKFKHNNNFSNLEEKRNYINDKTFKFVGNKFYLAINVNTDGIITEVTKYNGYKAKSISYGMSTLIFIGLMFWLYN